jgi:hypothetical protein
VLVTELLPEFASLPVEGVFDGGLVAFGTDGLPSFERLSWRILKPAAVEAGLTCASMLFREGWNAA